MRLHGRDQVKRARRKRQLRHRAFLNLNPPGMQPLLIHSPGHGDARFRKINSINFAFVRQRGEITHGSAATTTHIENCVVFSDRDMRQAPIGELGMPRVHVPRDELAHPPGGLLALICASTHAGRGPYSVRQSTLANLVSLIIHFLENLRVGFEFASAKSFGHGHSAHMSTPAGTATAANIMDNARRDLKG
jgi:hypothetical protein